MQHYCRNCNAPIQPGSATCVSCGMPLQSMQSIQPAAQPSGPPPGVSAAPMSGAPSGPPASSAVRPARPPARHTPAARPRSRRRLLYALLGTLLLILIVIIGVIYSGIRASAEATQQPPTTGAHITSIQLGSGFDTTKSLISGPARSFKTGQAVFVVFAVKNQNPNAQIVLKLFQGSALESTSSALTPDIGTNTYAITIIVYTTGAHTCQLDYNGTAEASIGFNVTS